MTRTLNRNWYAYQHSYSWLLFPRTCTHTCTYELLSVPVLLLMNWCPCVPVLVTWYPYPFSCSCTQTSAQCTGHGEWRMLFSKDGHRTFLIDSAEVTSVLASIHDLLLKGDLTVGSSNCDHPLWVDMCNIRICRSPGCYDVKFVPDHFRPHIGQSNGVIVSWKCSCLSIKRSRSDAQVHKEVDK